MRHAKAEQNSGIRDFDRALAERGLKDLRKIAKRLCDDEYRPDRIICSPALRTKSTAQAFAKVCGEKITIVEDPSLYASTAMAYIESARANGADSQNLMIVGHNPELEELLALLTSKKESLAIHPRMPTSAIACLELLGRGDWRTIDTASCRLLFLLIPKIS